MKKMTRIESARIVENKKGVCIGILCADCFTTRKKCGCEELGRLSWDKRKLQLAEAYIKRHEQKCKKSIVPKYTADVQPDTTGSELKKIVMKPAKHDSTPLEIAKAIRDKDYVCRWSSDVCKICPIRNAITGQERCGENRKQLIDSYIKANEPACEHLVGDLCGNAFETCDKECPANSEILKPEPKKIVCVDTNSWSFISVGKVYDVMSEEDSTYAIKNDADFVHHYYKNLFVAPEEYVKRMAIETDNKTKPEPVTVKAFEGCEHLKDGDCTRYMPCGDTSCPAYKPKPVIEPIKFQLPKIAFVVFADGIGVRSKNFTIDSDGNLIHSGCLCYDNIDKAVAVWNATYGKEVKK